MSRTTEMAGEIDRLQSAIRKHRDYRGDHRCHLDDGELYAVLPEGDTRPARDTAVTLENCERYIACRQQGREYVSPQTRIEELEAENKRLREALQRLAAVECLFCSRSAFAREVLEDRT